MSRFEDKLKPYLNNLGGNSLEITQTNAASS